ncbi:MAG: sec-independent protein translocase protein TatC [Solirubrobacteraceae bacterium]|jgi:sec-independent protein translocase protein TatC|nr:sec-independent protein translocase protein TatC [Solirubrobacteraceae bacterium]
MATRLRPIGHEDRLSVMDHLDELRSRLVVSAITLAIAFAFCFWQNHTLLHVLNQPLEDSTPTAAKHSGHGRLADTAAAQSDQRAGIVEQQRAEELLSRSHAQSPADRRAHALAARGLAKQAAALPKTVPKREPITTGVGEPFTTTLTVALYFALLFSLPVLLFQAYSFVLPAFSPGERRVALPVMLMVPFLFIGGVLFAYFLVLPPAISFLQNFNDQSFDVLIQAKPYYTFEIFTLLALGLMFQLPVGALAMQRVGIIDDRTLTRHWRYAVVIIAVVAAALPGVDPVTTSLEMIPLLGLYALSILLLKLGGRRRRRAEADDDTLALREDDD